MPLRDWTLKEIVQGKPWAHPTHPLFVHFPTALYPAALLFDLLSRLGKTADWQRPATVLIGLGLAGAAPAIVTGLIDWAGMVPTSTKRKRATTHLLVQSCAQAAAAATFAVHVAGYGAQATFAQTGLLALTVAGVVWGNWLGGVLVYRLAMRVGGKPEPSRRRPASTE